MIDLCVLVLLEKGALFLGHPVYGKYVHQTNNKKTSDPSWL